MQYCNLPIRHSVISKVFWQGRCCSIVLLIISAVKFSFREVFWQGRCCNIVLLIISAVLINGSHHPVRLVFFPLRLVASGLFTLSCLQASCFLVSRLQASCLFHTLVRRPKRLPPRPTSTRCTRHISANQGPCQSKVRVILSCLQASCLSHMLILIGVWRRPCRQISLSSVRCTP